MFNQENINQLMQEHLNSEDIKEYINEKIKKVVKEPVGANIICTPIVTDTRSYNIGSSDYSKHKIQPWDIWLEYQLNPWDADIVKRVLRTKDGEDRKLDYEKIIHICKERIRQIEQCKNKLL